MRRRGRAGQLFGVRPGVPKKLSSAARYAWASAACGGVTPVSGMDASFVRSLTAAA
jgi:hypothetical protein